MNLWSWTASRLHAWCELGSSRTLSAQAHLLVDHLRVESMVKRGKSRWSHGQSRGRRQQSRSLTVRSRRKPLPRGQAKGKKRPGGVGTIFLA